MNISLPFPQSVQLTSAHEWTRVNHVAILLVAACLVLVFSFGFVNDGPNVDVVRLLDIFRHDLVSSPARILTRICLVIGTR